MLLPPQDNFGPPRRTGSIFTARTRAKTRKPDSHFCHTTPPPPCFVGQRSKVGHRQKVHPKSGALCTGAVHRPCLPESSVSCFTFPLGRKGQNWGPARGVPPVGWPRGIQRDGRQSIVEAQGFYLRRAGSPWSLLVNGKLVSFSKKKSEGVKSP